VSTGERETTTVGVDAERRRRPANRRDSIVSAAATLFAQRGYGAVSIDDIGAAVGVSGPAIYKHFRGKEALLREIIVGNTARIADAVAATSGSGDVGAEARIRLNVAAVLDQPASLSTSIREFERLREVGGYRDWAAMQKRIDAHWQEILRTLNPKLDEAGIRTRMAAVLGAMTAATRFPLDVPRPRLDEVFVASAVAIASCPQVPARAPDAAPMWLAPTTRRDDIVRAAARLFREKGFGSVGVNDIGDAAGITGPTMYHYFETKADVLVEVYDRAGQRALVGAEDALARASSAADAVESLVRAFVRLAIDDADLVIVAERERDSLPAAARPRLVRSWLAIEDRWTAVMQEVRPDVVEPELRLLIRMGFPLISQAVVSCAEPAPQLDDICAVTVAHLRRSVL